MAVSQVTVEQAPEDLRPPRADIAAHASFLSGLFDEPETHLCGCVHVDPPEKAGDADAEGSCWIVDRRHPRLIGWDVTCDEWLALPDLA